MWLSNLSLVLPDRVISNGALRIDGDRIAEVREAPVDHGIDCGGALVAPGFIDILASIGRNREAHTFKIGDGVTTVLGMHGGPLDVERYVEEHTAVGPLANYAATVSHAGLREAVGATDRYAPATPEQIEAMRPLAVRAIRDGAVGIGFGVNYTPGASYEEIFALFEVAAAEGVPCHLHARYKGNVFPLTMSLAAMEVVAIAAATCPPPISSTWGIGSITSIAIVTWPPHRLSSATTS